MREIAEDFSPAAVMVAITGGEPLLKPGLFDLLAELEKLGFKFGMVSNGSLLSQEAAQKLVAAGIGSISLSLDGPPDLNDTLRGQGLAQKVERAVAALFAAGYPGKLEIMTTVTRPAVDRLEEMRNYVSELKVPFWRLVPVMPIGRAAKRPDLVPGPEEVRQVLDFVRQAREDHHLPQPEFGEEGYLGDGYELKVRPFLCQCRAGITTAGILADGRIGACPELADAFVQGHLNTDRFSKVWAERYQIFRDRSWTKKGPCADCDSFDRCQGGSLHLYPEPNADILRCFYKMLEPGK